MAPRRVHPGRAKPRAEEPATDEDDEFGFLASQQPSESDDNDFEEAFVERYAAVKKEKQRQFLKTAYQQLNRDLSASSDEVKATINKTETLFADFLLQYAACEDNIHNILGQILTEQQKLLTFVDKRGAVNMEAGKKIEAGHISGLSRTKAACTKYQEVIDKIVPQPL